MIALEVLCHGEQEIAMQFIAVQLLGVAIACSPAPAGWEGFFGYVAGSTIIYASAAMRMGRWWM